jgi:glycosyltransferase involved in cell wall biosynthesis
MAESGATDDFKSAAAVQAVASLPLISFVVTNYNYGEFLDRCLKSIFNQKYPNIECVLVDDASTDNSLEIAKAIVPPPHRCFSLVVNSKNLGQTQACIEGFERTSGAYVAFIDADDELDPDYALAHIWAHFSSRRAIGFSSCDLAICINGEIVSSAVLNHFTLKHETEPQDASEVRALNPRAASFFSGLRPFRLFYVNPRTLSWPWAPTTGTVYRRDAAALFLNNTTIGKLPYSTDAYLNYGINALCGSVLIDEAFGVYHIHKRNFFARSAPLSGTKHFDSTRDFGAFAAQCALEHIVKNFEFFSEKAYILSQLDDAMKILSQKASQGSTRSRIGSNLAKKVLAAKWRLKLRGVVSKKR